MTLRQVVKRIDYWQHHPALKHLGLAHWRFTVKWHGDCLTTIGGEELPDYIDLAASATTSDFYTDADLTFSEEAMNDPLYEDDEDRYIVHELLHVAMRDLDVALDADLKDYLPPPLLRAHRARLNHEKEAHIDALARCIVAFDRAAK